MRLRTERLLVRILDPERDAGPLLPLYSDGRVMRFIGGQTLADEDAVRAFLTARLARSAPPPLGMWAVEEADGTLVGTALLDAVPLTATSEPTRLSDEVQLGGALRRDRWRLGYGRELGEALVRHAFDTLGLESLVAVAEPDHPVSHELVGQLGFEREGETTAFYGGIPLVLYRLVSGDPRWA